MIKIIYKTVLYVQTSIKLIEKQLIVFICKKSDLYDSNHYNLFISYCILDLQYYKQGYNI
jgi:hypothetical protein